MVDETEVPRRPGVPLGLVSKIVSSAAIKDIFLYKHSGVDYTARQNIGKGNPCYNASHAHAPIHHAISISDCPYYFSISPLQLPRRQNTFYFIAAPTAVQQPLKASPFPLTNHVPV